MSNNSMLTILVLRVHDIICTLANVCPMLLFFICCLKKTIKTKKATRTKIGVHVCYINAYLHEFFEPISID